MSIFLFLSNMDHFIQLYLCVFFAHAEEMASVYDEIDIKDESLFPSLESDQVCSMLVMTFIFIIDYHKTHVLIRKIYIEEGTPFFELKNFCMTM